MIRSPGRSKPKTGEEGVGCGQSEWYIGLLGAALTGVLAALVAPRHFGRGGGLAVLGGVTALTIRDATMALTGVPGRLKALPRVLLYLELASAASATLLGVAAWLRPSPHVQGEGGRSAPLLASTVSAAASGTSALTFLLHTVRQAIYLSPGRGRLSPGADRRGAE